MADDKPQLELLKSAASGLVTVARSKDASSSREKTRRSNLKFRGLAE